MVRKDVQNLMNKEKTSLSQFASATIHQLQRGVEQLQQKVSPSFDSSRNAITERMWWKESFVQPVASIFAPAVEALTAQPHPQPLFPPPQQPGMDITDLAWLLMD